nr:PEP-CTERM sorting domain-containing protein [uncultured Duganella sp.]
MKQLISLFGGLILFSSAQAAVVSYDFTATINAIQEGTFTDSQSSVISSAKAGTSYSIGDIVHGHFEYDTQTGLLNYQPAQSPFGTHLLYEDAGAKNKLVATTSSGATLPAVSPPPLLQVRDDVEPGSDIFAIGRVDYLDSAYQTTSVLLIDPSANWLNSSAIPSSLLGYSYGLFKTDYFFLNDRSSLGVSASITSLTPTSPVPEPASYVMLLAGLLTVVYFRRARAA